MTWKPYQLGALWNWLPAFRAVAETQHLPTAAKLLHVSPPALSRTIKLLEGELGAPLFARQGRNLVINEAGIAFLDSVRFAMRMTDEGIRRLKSVHLTGSVNLAMPEPWAALYLYPCLAELRRAHPALVPCLHRPGNLHKRLLQGRVDLALTETPIEDDNLINHLLTTAPHGVFARPGHPALRTTTKALAGLRDHAFVAPVAQLQQAAADAWPVEVARRIAVRVDGTHVAIALAKAQPLLVVLPVPLGVGHGLKQLKTPLRSQSSLYAVLRKALPFRSKAELILDALRGQLHDT